MVFVIADTHFGHTNIIRHCGRPFASAEEMDAVMMENWNSVVSENDDVYIVGDFAFKVDHPEKYADMLNGRKHLIVGNHDRKNLKNPEFRKRFVEIKDIKTIRHDSVSIVLCHYPLAEWDGMYRGAYHFFGHIHNNDSRAQQIMNSIENAYNVGADVIGFAPRAVDEIIGMARENSKVLYKVADCEIKCVTCNWLKYCMRSVWSEDWICSNPKSENYKLNIKHSDSCKFWEPENAVVRKDLQNV